MKKMGFVGEAVAVTVSGEVNVPPSVGLETLRGKSLEPGGGGTCAGGAGNGLVCGVHVIATGGTDGSEGCVGGGNEVVFEELPHPVSNAAHANKVMSERELIL